MHIETSPAKCQHAPRSSRANLAPQKKEGRVAVIAVAAAGRSITTRFLLGREQATGRLTCVRLTARGCHAGQLTFPALLDCLPNEDGTCSFEKPTSPLLSLQLNSGHGPRSGRSPH